MKTILGSTIEPPGAVHPRLHQPESSPDTGRDDKALKADSMRRLKGYQALVERAIDVFGDEIKAARWLSKPSRDLDGIVPLQRAQEVGYDPAKMEEIFEPIFIVIEHGIYT